LDGFKYHVFLDFREIQDNDYGHYRQLTSYLGGRGVPSIDQALKETFLSPVHEPFLHIIDSNFLKDFTDLTLSQDKQNKIIRMLEEKYQKSLIEFLSRVQEYVSTNADILKIVNNIISKFRYLIQINEITTFLEIKPTTKTKTALNFLKNNAPSPSLLLIWLSVAEIGKLQDESYSRIISLSWLDEVLLSKLIEQCFLQEGFDDYNSNRRILLIKILTLAPNWLEDYDKNPGAAIKALFQYQEVQKYLRVNQYQETFYFHYESFIELLAAFYSTAILSMSLLKKVDKAKIKKRLVGWYSRIDEIIKFANDNNCKVDPTIEAILTVELTNDK
jgi:hypothetical protein